MRIHTDNNGVYVNAISTDSAGNDVSGHQYQVICGMKVTYLTFQNGAVQANGVNGLTNEALLAVLIHRVRALDAKFPCNENHYALQHMEEALIALEVRTARRMTRGVEGQEVA